MKKVLIFLCSLIFLQNIFAQKKDEAAKYYKLIVSDLTKKHLPKIYQDVVADYYCGPDTYKRYVGGKYIKWDMDTKDETVYKELPTILHESVHSFNQGPFLHKSNGKFVKISGKLLVSIDNSISYESKSDGIIVKSHNIVDDMRRDNPKVDDLFRFTTYIDNGKDGNSSSNTRGVFGIMDEFSAYYHGSNVAFILYKDLKKHNIMNIYNWKKNDGSHHDTLIMENVNLTKALASKAMSSYPSYYEFSIYIGAYLTYVKKHRKEIYNEIMMNTEFRKAYTIIDRNFQNLVLTMEKEFGQEYEPYEGAMFKITTAVDNLNLSKEIIHQYIDILDSFKITNAISSID